jgi:hypothetical protein
MPDTPGPLSSDPVIDAEKVPLDGAALEPEYSFPLRRFLILLVFVPMLWLGFLMYTYGVDTPYWDEWDEIPADLVKLHAGTLSWSDLIAQHNEHRILFPRIVMLATAWLTSWNVRAELLIIWLLAGVCSFNLWRLNRITGGTNSNRDLLLLTAANVLLFTPVAFENWLWGFQIGFLLPLAAVTLAIWLVSAKRSINSAFFFAIALSFVCTFSMASGFLCWLVVLPLLLFPEGRLQWRDRTFGLVCWLVGLVGSVALYLYGYVQSGDGPSLLRVMEDPGTAISYLLAYFGSAFGWNIGYTPILIFGGTWPLLFVCALLYLWRFRTDARLITQTLPWVMLGSYAVLNGVATMLGRIQFGASQATGPRYITFAVMLPISLLFIWQRVYLHWRQGSVTRPQVQVFRTLLLACLGLGLAANLFCSLAILNSWVYWHQARLISKALVEFVLITKEESLTNGAHLTYGDFDRLREDARQMGELGYLRPAPVTDSSIAAFTDLPFTPSPEHGYFDGIIQGKDGQFYIYGWAVLPGEGRPADAVLLTYEDKDHPGIPLIYSITMTGLERGDVVQSTQEENYDLAGWLRPLTPGLLPPGPHVLRAWAFDFGENRAYPLEGAHEFDEAAPAISGQTPH